MEPVAQLVHDDNDGERGLRRGRAVFDRWRKRRSLLREAARLEAEARTARRSLARVIAGAWGPGAAGAAIALATVARFASPEGGVRSAAIAVHEALWAKDAERATALESQARALREEARGLRA